VDGATELVEEMIDEEELETGQVGLTLLSE
jgi:hypothetical protein